MSVRVIKLAEVAEINPRRPPLDIADDELVTFVPMESVDDVTGVVATPFERKFVQVKKGYTVFAENDVIFAKITPCMQNGKHAIVRNLLNGVGFGSTEFHVIRASEHIIPEWIHFFLRRQDTLDAAVQTFTGTVGQQRVPSSFLENLELPLPAIDEQRRIAARLKAQLAAVEEARQAAQAQIDEAKKLIPAILTKAFAGVILDEDRCLGDLFEIQLGKMLSPKSKTGQSSFPYLRNQNIQWGRVLLDDLAEMDFSESERQKFELREEDLLICEGGEPGRCALWQNQCQNVYYQKALHRIRPISQEVSTKLLMYWLWHLAEIGAFEDQNSKTTIAHLPVVRLQELLFPVMPLSEQTYLAEALEARFAQAKAVMEALVLQLQEIELLPIRLLAQAFEGH